MWTTRCGNGISIPCRSNDSLMRRLNSTFTGQKSPLSTHIRAGAKGRRTTLLSGRKVASAYGPAYAPDGRTITYVMRNW